MQSVSSYQDLPTKPGVYLYKNAKNKVIYVGKAKDLRKRVSSYFNNHRTLDAKTIRLISEISSISYIQVVSELEAFLLESSLIKKYKPFYNIKMADDKSFPYIVIVNGDNPFISMSRKKDEKTAKYFGPYPNVTDVKIVLKLLRRIFPFQSVKHHSKKACLYYHLGLCPCIGAHPENEFEYNKNLKRIAEFLKGNKGLVKRDLIRDQKQAITQEEFEKAQEIQKKIEKIDLVTSENYNPFRYQEHPGLYYERISEELQSLKQILQGEGVKVQELERIECYDISNTSGKQAVGSMVVLLNGETANSEYRRFRIRTKDTPDDFHMMKEVISRRIKNIQWAYPDLFVIDGGKGQVGSVLPILRRSGIMIPVIGLAKREETIIVPVEYERNHFEYREVKLPRNTPGINMLRKIRDEAHRFAITYHRSLRKKKMLELLA